MVDAFAAAEALYTVFDPDQAPVSMKANASQRNPASAYELLTGLDCILDLAGFRPVPGVYVEVARQVSAGGLKVLSPSLDALSMQLYYRRILPTIVRSCQDHQSGGTSELFTCSVIMMVVFTSQHATDSEAALAPTMD